MSLHHAHTLLHPFNILWASITHVLWNTMFCSVFTHWAQLAVSIIHIGVRSSTVAHNTYQWTPSKRTSPFLSSQQLPIDLHQIFSFRIPSPQYDFELVWSGKSLIQITSSAVSSYVQHPCCFIYTFCGLSAEIYLETCWGGSDFIYGCPIYVKPLTVTYS